MTKKKPFEAMTLDEVFDVEEKHSANLGRTGGLKRQQAARAKVLARIAEIERELAALPRTPTTATVFRRKTLMRKRDRIRLAAGMVTPAELQHENDPFRGKDFSKAKIVWKRRIADIQAGTAKGRPLDDALADARKIVGASAAKRMTKAPKARSLELVIEAALALGNLTPKDQLALLADVGERVKRTAGERVYSRSKADAARILFEDEPAALAKSGPLPDTPGKLPSKYASGATLEKRLAELVNEGVQASRGKRKKTRAGKGARRQIIAALEREQREQARRISQLRKCDDATFEQALASFENPLGAGQWLADHVKQLETAKGREEARRLLGRIDSGTA